MTTDYDELRRQRFAALDDEMKAVYEAIGPGRSLRDLGVQRYRAIAEEQQVKTYGSGRDDVSTETVQVPGPHGDVPTRIYRPAGVAQPGAYIHTHGGGFVGMGGFDAVDGMNSELAQQWGCVIIHPDFRLPPEHKFPIGLDDCWAATQWVGQQADAIGIDRDRVAIGGGCTGANMAAVISLMARDAGGPGIALQHLYAPELDLRSDYRSHFEYANGYGLTRDTDLWVAEQYLNDMEERWDWRASPVLVESVKGVAPALISVGEWEVLRDETRHYANRLRDADVTVHYMEGPAGGHGYNQWRDPRTGELTKTAAAHTAAMRDIIRSYVGPESRQRSGT